MEPWANSQEQTVTSKVCAFFTLLLAWLVACSPAPPTATLPPTATETDIATSLPAPKPTASPTPTSIALPTPTAVPLAVIVPIGELTAARIGEKASVNGQVTDSASFSKGFKFTLDDGTGQIVLLTWLETYDGIAGREGLRPGASVEVTGEIDQFEGELEIVPTTGADVVVRATGSKHAPERKTGSLTAEDVGSWVLMEGEVVRARTFSLGERIFLDDGSGEVMLLLWQNVLERLPDGPGVPTVGSQLRAIGRVEEYQGTLEVVPALPFDVDVVFLAPTETPAPTRVFVPIGELHAGRIGETATIAGQVTDTAGFSGGFKLTLDDGTGQIVLLTWHNIYDALQNPEQLNIGATVHITGEISQFEGELQIEPHTATDVEVTVPGAPSAPRREIGSVADHLGQRITVIGETVRTQETGYGSKVYVGDDTGEALVYIWANILERIPNHQALGKAGTNVRIVGVVQEYRGDLEIVPALPTDVEVLE